VGRGGAARSLDWGWEAAAAAVDGEQTLQRGSGKVENSGKERAVEMQTRESKSGLVGSSRTCLGSRRRLGRARAGAGKPAGCVAARAAAAQRGEARGEPARGGERQGGCWGSMWRRGKRRGAAGARETVSEGGRITSAGQSRGRTGGRRRGICLQFPESAGTPLKS
jgi:hypothetical protein